MNIDFNFFPHFATTRGRAKLNLVVKLSIARGYLFTAHSYVDCRAIRMITYYPLFLYGTLCDVMKIRFRRFANFTVPFYHLSIFLAGVVLTRGLAPIP